MYVFIWKYKTHTKKHTKTFTAGNGNYLLVQTNYIT